MFRTFYTHQLWLDYRQSGQYQLALYRVQRKASCLSAQLLGHQAELADFEQVAQYFADSLMGFCRKSKLALAVVLSPEQYLTQQVSLPAEYTDTDIKQYIDQSHAELFPHSTDELVYDFVRLPKSNPNQDQFDQEITIQIAALAQVHYQAIKNLISTISQSGASLRLCYLGSDLTVFAQDVIINKTAPVLLNQQVYTQINFNDWRKQRQSYYRCRALWQAFALSVFILLCFIVSYQYHDQALQQAKQQSINLQQQLPSAEQMTEQLQQITNLRRDYLSQFTAQQARQAEQHQAKQLFCVLTEIVTHRPIDLVLTKIVLDKPNQLQLIGQSKSLVLVQKYIKQLATQCTIDQVRVNKIERINPALDDLVTHFSLAVFFS